MPPPHPPTPMERLKGNTGAAAICATVLYIKGGYMIWFTRVLQFFTFCFTCEVIYAIWLILNPIAKRIYDSIPYDSHLVLRRRLFLRLNPHPPIFFVHPLAAAHIALCIGKPEVIPYQGYESPPPYNPYTWSVRTWGWVLVEEAQLNPEETEILGRFVFEHGVTGKEKRRVIEWAAARFRNKWHDDYLIENVGRGPPSVTWQVEQDFGSYVPEALAVVRRADEVERGRYKGVGVGLVRGFWGLVGWKM